MGKTVLPLLPYLLLLAAAAHQCGAVSWDEERLQWLVVTPPGASLVLLNCTSEHIYPFMLLNDTVSIGEPDSLVKRIWWLLPDGRRANETFDDGNRQVQGRGVQLLVRHVEENVQGLYHCAVEAKRMLNESYIDPVNVTVYYYKRGLNLYGPNLHGGNSWEKYKRNTLIGSLTAGAFLLVLAGIAVLDKLGVLAKCSSARSNTVDTFGGQEEMQEAAPAAVAAEEHDGHEEKKEEAAAPGSADQSRASVRSRRSDRATVETAAV